MLLSVTEGYNLPVNRLSPRHGENVPPSGTTRNAVSCGDRSPTLFPAAVRVCFARGLAWKHLLKAIAPGMMICESPRVSNHETLSDLEGKRERPFG
jgi:hypothetical protein